MDTRHRVASLLLAALALAPAPAPGQETATARAIGSHVDAATGAGPLAVIANARSYLRVPYLSGGDSRAGMDCSGLVYRVFRDVVGMELPRGVGALYREGRPAGVPLHIGDLLFFDTDEKGSVSTPTHVGVYAGGGTFVHAASEGSRSGVTVSSLETPYYRDRFLGARRVYPWPSPVLAVTVTDGHVVESRDSPYPSREALAVDVYNGMSGGGPVDVSILRDGVPVLSRRIVPGARKPAELTIVPDVGSWTVRVTRIFKGRELAAVSFLVEE